MVANGTSKGVAALLMRSWVPPLFPPYYGECSEQESFDARYANLGQQPQVRSGQQLLRRHVCGSLRSSQPLAEQRTVEKQRHRVPHRGPPLDARCLPLAQHFHPAAVVAPPNVPMKLSTFGMPSAASAKPAAVASAPITRGRKYTAVVMSVIAAVARRSRCREPEHGEDKCEQSTADRMRLSGKQEGGHDQALKSEGVGIWAKPSILTRLRIGRGMPRIRET